MNDVSLVIRLASGLHAAGTPAHRLEGLLAQIADHLGVHADVFSTPTAVFVTIGTGETARTVLLRLAPGGLDIGRQAELDGLAEALLSDAVSPARALELLDDLEQTPPPYGSAATVAAFAFTGASAAVALGGGPYEALSSAIAGTLVGLVERNLHRRPDAAYLFEAVATFLAMASAMLVHHLIAPIDVVVATLAAVIVLLPGLSFTTAITELATRNLVSGTARMAGALVVLLGMAVGAALAAPLGGWLPPSPDVAPAAVPAWGIWLVLPVVGVTFAVLLRARPRDTGWVMLAPMIALALAQAGVQLMGPVVGVGAAAFGLALVSNGIARWRRRPASTMLTPGVLLLVPGSAALRAVLLLVDHDVNAGVDGFFEAALVATALAAGVLTANLVVAPRRGL